MNEAFASEVSETPRMAAPSVEPKKPARIMKRENSMKLAMESKVSDCNAGFFFLI